MRTAILLLGLVWATGLPAAEVKLVQVKKIWDQAPHNAFTDLIRFGERWYCCCREGKGHAAGAGTLRVLVSTDGEKWESAALLESKDVDLRDPKLSVTPEGRLLMVAGAAAPASRDPLRDHYSVVSFSKDGKVWTAPQRVLEGWHWLWRLTWHKGKVYGVSYQWDPKERAKGSTASLYFSQDGLKYLKAADWNFANPTEATLAFDGDTLWCLQRRDGKPNTAMLGRAEPPYTDKQWNWKDLGVYLGGPNFLRLPDGSWWACGRLMEKGKAQTVLCQLDVKDGKLRPALTLPSGGDNSYPGMVWHDNQLWVSYYSSHEGKSSIYLARIQLSGR